MIRVIHNVIVDWKKARARCQELNPDLPAPASVEPEESSLDQLLEKSNVSLSTRERQILDLRLQGLRYSEVAGALGIGEGSVSRYLNRAFSKLRRLRKG
jgi:RNA polymerase sigma factor (sigma-70 family)